MKSIKTAVFARYVVLSVALILASLQPLQGKQPEDKSTDYPTLGNPTSAVATQDGRYVFVSVTNVSNSNFGTPGQTAGGHADVVSGVQIFRVKSSRLKSTGFIRTGSTGANGLILLKGEKTLAVGAGDAGVAFLDVQEMIRGTAKPSIAAQGDKAGTLDVVASSDGRFVFSANESALVQGQRGSVGIIAVNPDAQGHVDHPQTTGQIPLGDVVPSLTISPDGSRLYVATELTPKTSPAIAGAGNPILTKDDCVQKKGSQPNANGFITVIDEQRAINGQSNPILSRVAAGCSPVRVIEAADSSVLFVSARGDAAILSFTPRLLESDPEHAFLRTRSSGGSAPVGIRLFALDKMLAVANSNRNADSGGTLTFLDVSANSTLHAPLKTWAAGIYPRNIGISRDGKTLYLTIYTSRSLRVIQRIVP